MKKVLFFLLAIIFAIQGYGQTVQTSFGTTTQQYMPLRAYYGYSYSQQIVTNAELVAGGLGTTYGQITKIRWYWNGTSNLANSSAWKIYFGHTTESSFASSTSWVPLTSLTLVYDSLMTIPSGAGWIEFILQTPFTYNGTDNLVIAVDENTPQYSDVDAYFTSQTPSSTRGIYYYNDTTNPDPASPPTGTTTSTIPNIQLYFLETCPGPGNLTSSAVTHENATVSWTPNGTETLWNLEYKISTDLTWTTITGLTTPTYTFNSLLPSITYNVRVQANCGTDQSAFILPISFTTLASAPTTLPYTSDFENPTENLNWGFINGTQTNQWIIGDASYNPNVNNTLGGSNALYISNDAGLTWAYTLATSSTPSRVYAYRDFSIDPGVTEIKLNLDWIANGNGYGDFLRVYWVPASAVITAGLVPPGALDVSNALGTFYNNTNNNIHLQQATTWQQNEFIINSTQFPTLGGNTWRLLIHWRNENTSAAVQPPATVDNISLVVVACATPTALAASNQTINSVDLTWTDNGSAASFNIQYKKSSETTWTTVQATSSPFTVTNLDPSSIYQFRIQADCGSEQSFFTNPISSNTLCGVISTLPWQFGFEETFTTNSTIGSSNSTAPHCWININGGTDTYYKWQRTTSPIRTGTGALQFYGGYYTPSSTYMNNDWMISPIITLTGNERLIFYTNSYSPSTYVDDIAVYVFSLTDNQLVDIAAATDTTLFDVVMPATVVTATGSNWQKFEINLSAYTGDVRIAFVRNYRNGGAYLNIDDIKIDALPTCIKPDSITVTNITAFDAEFNWNPGNPNNTTFWIYYKPSTSASWDSVQVTGTNHIFTTLLPATIYQYYLKTDCGTEFSEATDVNTFITTCVPVSTLPWNEGFEGLTAASTLPPCWAATSFGSYTNTQIVNYGSYNRNARTGTGAAYYRYGCNDRFFTPGMQLTAGVAYKFSYWYVTDGLSGWTTLQSGVYSAQNANSLIQTSNTINGPVNTTYQEVVSYFTPTTDGIYYFGVYCLSNSVPWYITLDDFSIELAPDCLPAQQLAVSNIVGTSAYASWLPAGTPDSYTVELSETGSGVWTTFSTTTPNFVLTNLTELTDYSVQVYPICSGVEGPRDTVDFTTICAAGGDLIIGTPNATTSTSGQYLPSELCYNYSYTQQIFDATEITADTIFNIAFQYFYNTPDTRNLTIYLGHSTQSTFTGTTNFVPFDSLTQVFQGNVTFTNVGLQNWVNITFTTPFDYNGSSNLVIAVRDMTGTYAICSETFRTHSTTGNKALYFYQDPGSIDPVNPVANSYGVSSYRNNIKINLPCETVTCYAPNVILTDVTSSSASMIIVPGASETSWEGEYKASSATSWTSLGTNVTSPYVLPALSSNTTYSVRFRAVCSVSDMSAWKTVTFTTDCGTIEVLPFVENFDTYTANYSNIPTCWTRLTTNGSYPYVYNYNTLSAPNALYFYTSSTTYAMIVLPPVDATIPLNTLQLTLWGRNYSIGQNVKVGVLTDPNDAATFTLIGTFTPVTASIYEEYIVSFANYTDTGVYIAIKSDNIAQSLTNEFFIDNLSLDLIPSCSKPLDIVFSAITTTTATASWDVNPTALSYEVVYGLPGVDPATATPIPVTDTFYVMTPLTATTLYHFYVRSVCAGGEFSEWTSLRTFSTVALAPVPYTEPFNTTVTPVGYNLTGFYVGSDYTNYVPGNPASNIYVNLYSSNPTANFKTINIGPLLPNYALAFEYKLALYSGGGVVPTGTGNFVVAISTDWGDTYTNVDTVDNNGLAGYQSYSLDLSAYDAQIIKIKVTGKWISSDYYLGIDNIYVGPAITCPMPNNLTSANATQTTVDLSWTENGTATEWVVEYGPLGFTQGSGTFVTANTNTSFTLSGLTATTCYDAYVRSICGVGDSSIWSNKITFCTAQIPAQVPITFDFETPSGFQFANISSGNNWNVGTATNNTTSGQNSMYISNDNGVSNQYTITNYSIVWAYRDITFPTSSADFTFTFDWKCMGEFSSPSYYYDFFNVYIGNPSTPAPSNTTATITIPSGASAIVTQLNNQNVWQNASYTLSAATYSGQTKRIYFCWVNDNSVGTQPPAAIDNISITTSTPACPIPTNLAISAINSTNATATWTAGGTETAWELAYKATAASTWTSILVNTTPSQLISSLTAGTDYDVKVRAICAPGDTSAWTSVVNFTTSTVSCNTPTNLAAGTITNTGATITWTAGGTETAWEVDYKLATATTWTTVNATAASTVLTGLATCSNYNVRVRAVCGVGIFSSYTTVVNFNTLSPVPTNLQVTNITDQGALATWTAGGTETSWQIEYKLVSSANWTTATVNGTPSHPLTGLQSNSLYEVRVKSLCSPNESVFTTPVQFTTLGMTFTINATAGLNGTITPSGTVTVNAGANQTFTFGPNTGYVVNVVNVDGTPIVGTPLSYTFTNIMANHTINVEFTVGIEENELAQLVELFPNPTTSIIELRLKSDELHVTECKVFDMYGKLMRVIPINAETTSIDVTDFASGVYFVRMDSERGTISKKFVKK